MKLEDFNLLRSTGPIRAFLSGIAFFILTLLFVLESIPMKGVAMFLSSFWLELFYASSLLILVSSVLDFFDDEISLKMEIDQLPSALKGILLNILFISLFGLIIAVYMIGLEFYDVIFKTSSLYFV